MTAEEKTNWTAIDSVVDNAIGRCVQDGTIWRCGACMGTGTTEAGVVHSDSCAMDEQREAYDVLHAASLEP